MTHEWEWVVCQVFGRGSHFSPSSIDGRLLSDCDWCKLFTGSGETGTGETESVRVFGPEAIIFHQIIINLNCCSIREETGIFASHSLGNSDWTGGAEVEVECSADAGGSE